MANFYMVFTMSYFDNKGAEKMNYLEELKLKMFPFGE